MNSASEVISEHKGGASEINITQTESRHFSEDIGNEKMYESNKETNKISDKVMSEIRLSVTNVAG